MNVDDIFSYDRLVTEEEANLQVHALIVLPSDPRVVLAGTLSKGLFRSTDGGETWQHNSFDDSQVWGLSVRPIQDGDLLQKQSIKDKESKTKRTRSY